MLVIPTKRGFLNDIKSKKTSFMRNLILATKGNSLRMTITMDMFLGPNYVAISKRLYDRLDLATNLVLINRAPSINSTCVYVLEILAFDECNDLTIHINPRRLGRRRNTNVLHKQIRRITHVHVENYHRRDEKSKLEIR